jgi:hypothetical protein
MKKLTIIFLLLSLSSFGQVNLPRGEDGKITYEEIVRADSIPKAVLYKNAKEWTYRIYKQTEKSIRCDSNTISVKGHYLVYTRGGVSKEIHGAIRYNLTIEVKDNKYKYKFSDFIFEYYKQNRNYQYVPTGKEKPLEDENFPAWEKAWENHKKELNEKIPHIISTLKSDIRKRDKTAQNKGSILKKEEW